MFKKVFLTILISTLLIFIALLAGGFYLYKTGYLQKQAVEYVEQQIYSTQDVGQSNLLSDLLGYTEPKNYLLLFLNNTEIRPGGGFIGSYGVVTLDQGKSDILKIEGTEIIDNLAPDFVSVPPDPLINFLKIDRWSFRDSNWSPDFYESTKKSLELYGKENGLLSGNIDAVFAFTPTVIEEVLKIAGPIEVDGIVFNAENFTEVLEYEVEYGFQDKGVHFSDRKDLLADLGPILLNKVKTSALLNWSEYLKLFEDMAEQKQVMIYSENEDWQKIIEIKNLDGRIKKTDGDYLLWADANLGALKTDVAIKRTLDYKIYPVEPKKYLAEVEMVYEHTGEFSWRVSRYIDYARIFVPAGSQSVDTENLKDFAEGEYLDLTWMGASIIIEPGQTKSLKFSYYLSDDIVEDIENGNYNLLVQKELGLVGAGLTLNMDFGKKITDAEPNEESEYWGDNIYNYHTDLKVDKSFNIKL